jgi:hypothetical protein
MLHAPLRLVVTAAPLFLIACSTTTGLTDETSSLGSHKRYVHAEELRASCTGLSQTIAASIKRIKDLREEAERAQSGPPPTVVAAWQRMFAGKGATTEAAAAVANERARIDELNAALREKGCNVVDIEQLLAPGAGPNK